MFFQTFMHFVEQIKDILKNVGNETVFGPIWDQKSSKYLVQQNANRFGATWKWVNFFISVWTIPLG